MYGRDYLPADVPADALTDVSYAFVTPVQAGGFYDCRFNDEAAAKKKRLPRLVPGTDVGSGEDRGLVNQFRVLRRAHPALKVLMSVGGGGEPTLASDLSHIAADAGLRQHFASACAHFMRDNGFDGIDVDWECPTAAEAGNFIALMHDLHSAMNALSPHYLLTFAAQANPAKLAGFDRPALDPLVDWVNVMAYDFHSAGDSHTSHPAPLGGSSQDPSGPSYSVNAAVAAWLGKMPAGKLNLGLAYYGKAFQHLQSAGPDPDVPGRFARVKAGDYPSSIWDKATPSGDFDYWDIRTRFSGTGSFISATRPVSGLNGYTRFWDAQQQGPFLYRADAVGSAGTGLWLSYDDPQSAAQKVAYAKARGLGGIFVW